MESCWLLNNVSHWVMAKWCWTRPLLTLGSSVRCSPSFSLEDSAELSDKHPLLPPVHFTLLAGLQLQLLSELQSFSQWEEETGKLKLSTRTPGHLLSYFMFKCSTELGQAERLCYWCGGLSLTPNKLEDTQLVVYSGEGGVTPPAKMLITLNKLSSPVSQCGCGRSRHTW